MTKKTFTIISKTGLHARPATSFVQTAERYKSEITLNYQQKSVNLKSIMGIMALGIQKGNEIIIKADGPDEEMALQGIEEVIKNEGLGE